MVIGIDQVDFLTTCGLWTSALDYLTPDARSVETYAKLDGSGIRAGLERLQRRGRDIALSPALGSFAGP